MAPGVRPEVPPRDHQLPDCVAIGFSEAKISTVVGRSKIAGIIPTSDVEVAETGHTAGAKAHHGAWFFEVF